MQIFKASTIVLVYILFAVLPAGEAEADTEYIEPVNDDEDPMEYPPMVLTELGPIQGTRMMHIRRHVDVYYGIPYAKPPVGKLRFKKPEPIEEPWSDIYIAENIAPACPQHQPDVPYPLADMMNGQSEDCLYLNVYVPAEESTCSKGRPVLFWIHGGGFKVGSNRMPVYDGRALSNIGSVIVVTVNYRVGPLGFLYTGTDDAPGNAGLYDILLALQWVNQYIYAFGGNRNRITIIGEDAGATAVGLLTMSPLAEGLYRRAVLQSGAPSFFIPTNLTRNLQMSEEFARDVKCSNKTQTLRKHTSAVLKCLRDLDAVTLMKAKNHDFAKTYLPIFPAYGDELLPKDPRTTLMKSEFHESELLIGCNQDEGSIDLVSRFPDLFGYTGEKDTKMNKTHASKLLKSVFDTFPDASEVAEHYLHDVDDEDFEEIRKQLYTAIGDFFYVCPTVFFAERFARKNSAVYFYYFTHRSTSTVYAQWMGVPHFTEVQYVFGQPMIHPHFYEEDDVPLSRRMIKRWTLFSKTGDPGGNWPHFNELHPKVRLFDPEKKVNTKLPTFENCEFFKSFYEE